MARAPAKNACPVAAFGWLSFWHPHSVSHMGRLPGMASIPAIQDSNVFAAGSQAPAFHPYQCVAMKSTRSIPVVSALTWVMKAWIQARPVALPCVAGLPMITEGFLNDGQSEIAVATGMFDWLALSGSLNPRTYV